MASPSPTDLSLTSPASDLDDAVTRNSDSSNTPPRSKQEEPAEEESQSARDKKIEELLEKITWDTVNVDNNGNPVG